LASTTLLTPFCRLVDGSYLVYIYQDQSHQRGEKMLVRVITYTFTDPRIPGAGEQVYRQVDHLIGSLPVPGPRVGRALS
jgi:hypothetical protein